MGRSYALRSKLEPLLRPKSRSKTTNMADALPRIDGRSPLARRFRDLVSQITSDLGGVDQISETKLQLVRRFCASVCLAEALESRLVNGEEIDVAQHALIVSSLVRISSRIGVERIAREIGLGDLLRADQQRQREEAG